MADRYDIDVTIAANPDLLAAVRAMVRSYFVSAGFPAGRVDELVLGIDEACANAVRHGCDGNPDRRFALRVVRLEEFIQIELRDPGRRIPKQEDAPDEPESLDEIEPGGLGLTLMRRVFDEVDVGRRLFGGNTLVLRVRRPALEQPQQATGGG